MGFYRKLPDNNNQKRKTNNRVVRYYKRKVHMMAYCSTCNSDFSAPRYYKAHLHYPRNLRCRLALEEKEEERVKGSDLQDVLAKRKYSELRDFTLHKHALGEKLSRMDDGLLGKVLAGYATNNMEEEEMSDDDNNYANFGDDTENDDENTHKIMMTIPRNPVRKRKKIVTKKKKIVKKIPTMRRRKKPKNLYRIADCEIIL